MVLFFKPPVGENFTDMAPLSQLDSRSNQSREERQRSISMMFIDYGQVGGLEIMSSLPSRS
jgi:hypothetical protein